MPELIAPRPGDHIMVDFRYFHHHGICVAPNRVIQYAAPPDDENARFITWSELFGSDSPGKTIHETDLDTFSQGRPIRIVLGNPEIPVYPPLKSVARARSRLGENGYNFWGNNCEHFVRWCRRANPNSRQINWIKSTGKGAMLGAMIGEFAGPIGVSVGASIGAMAGSMKHWFLGHPEAPLVDQEFATHISFLYASLPGQFPLGRHFRHESEWDPNRFPACELPEDLLFFQRIKPLFSNRDDSFCVTASRIFLVEDHSNVTFDEIAAIRSDRGRVQIIGLDGNVSMTLAPTPRYAPRLAAFLESGIAGTSIPNRKALFPRPLHHEHRNLDVPVVRELGLDHDDRRFRGGRVDDDMISCCVACVSCLVDGPHMEVPVAVLHILVADRCSWLDDLVRLGVWAPVEVKAVPLDWF